MSAAGGLRASVPLLTWIDVVQQACAHAPHAPAVYFCEGESKQPLTYLEADQRARAIAARLQRHTRVGDRAVLLYEPGIEYIVGLLGCFYAGVVAVPVYAPRGNPHLDRVVLILDAARACVLMSTSKVWGALSESAPFHPLLTRGRWLLTDTAPAADPSAWQRPALSSDSLALLQFTSGSTGDPKGVMLNHRHLLANSALIQRAMACSRSEVSVMWLPPYHDMGLIGALLQAFYTRFPVYLMNPAAFVQRPLRWLELISSLRGTASVAPNFAYDLCVRRVRPEHLARLDLSSWTLAGNGAEPLRAGTMRRFAETFGPCGFDERAFFPCYGMAETTLYVAGAGRGQGFRSVLADRVALERHEWRPAGATSSGGRVELVSSGRVAPEFEVMIVDAERHRACMPGRVGEIWIRGDSVAAGYWERAEATAEVFQARLQGDTRPWLRSGDLGFLHEGELFITGRMKDLIIIGGRNHHPHDVEATVLAVATSQRLHQAAAFGIDGDEGEQLVVAVELQGKCADGPLEPAERAIREAVSRQHQLQVGHVVFVARNTLPLTSSGKLRRYLVRERWRAGELPVLPETLPTLAASTT